ncbi:MAG: PepSY domain-containing protein [Bacteroidota bacterium]|nr:PepSY domain-containing protein [Bacteroidota bacterium]
MKFLRKYHKWLGILSTLFIILFSLSGIVLNHREFFSNIDVDRNILAEDYQYNNWKNASVKGTEKINNDSILIYGNIGIWLTDSTFSDFKNFNNGFPDGIDNKKVCKIFKNSTGHLFAGSLFGLYQYNADKNRWNKIELPIHEKRIVDIAQKQDTLLILSRSHLLKSVDNKNFTVIPLPQPENYNNQISLFKTLMNIHSGKIFGMPGRLFVDLLGLILIFLSIGGIILFINPKLIKRRKRKKKNRDILIKFTRWNIRWHNKIGWITLLFMVIITITGMFLRPPLLIPIAYTKVDAIPHTHLDSKNPWNDKLRRIIYDNKNEKYILATLDGLFYSDDNFSSKIKKYKKQPPISVMGVNVFKLLDHNSILIGSFEGLYRFFPETDYVQDYVTKKEFINRGYSSIPIGKFMAAGYSDDYLDKEIYFDFNHGAININDRSNFISIPDKIKYQPMSLWNFALEVHTARIFQSLVGVFYILFIPLFGLIMLFILISGFTIWFKRYRRNRKHN